MESAKLERFPDALALRALEPLGDEQRRRLVAAMSEVERLLQASPVQFSLETPESDEAKSALSNTSANSTSALGQDSTHLLACYFSAS
ncbi:hypothetical protein [Paraburkholderia flagellata]|uniref:hypothetical protein n=1 Tax=Paraburkholderia flagellata TaxID=2883241 RepID=UPI001F46C6F0|nr:hypothetical protein [Paraburkholderia flagellata]